MGRPVGVTILAVLYFIGAAFCLLGGIGMMLGGGFMASILSQQGGGAAGLLAGLGAALGIVFLIFGALYVLFGWGMLKLKNWARIITIVLSALGALGALLGLAAIFAHFGMFIVVTSLIRLAISVWIIWYLLQPHVKAAFEGGQARAAGA